jgi:hypothetical protein
MLTTVKTLAALTLSLTILAGAPANALLMENGWSNGVWGNGWSNGIWSNGIWENGWQNGFGNGVSMNGLGQNGRPADAHRARVIGIELPSEAVVR